MPRVVSDTGPILALARLQQLDLLHHLFGQIILAQAVRAEITDRLSVAALNSAKWITVQSANDVLALQLMREELDPGESETLILAKELEAELVIIDERAATRRARVLGLKVIGTLGILLLGKRDGYLAAVRPMLDQLRRAGFHMGADLYDQVLQSAGEA